MESKKSLFGVHVGMLAAASVGVVLAVGCSPEGNGSASEPTATVSEALSPCDPTAAFDPPVPAFTGTALIDAITFSANGNTAYLSGRVPGATNSEIYTATRDPNTDQWSALSALPSGVSTTSSERSPSLSADGYRLYFARYLGGQRFNLMVSTRTDLNVQFGAAGTTTAAVPNVNQPDLHDQDPFFLSGPGHLYFAAEPVDGTRDIRVSVVNTTVNPPTYGSPQLVPVDPTQGYDEYRPVLSPDGLTIYFSSTRPGIGDDTGGDIFVAMRASANPPTNSFTTITNLAGLNTNRIEYPAALSNDGCTLYFASNRDTPAISEYRLYKATRGADAPTMVSTAIKVVGSGSVTVNGSACSSTCTFQGATNSTAVVLASAQAIWGGSCTGYGSNPGGDGILAFTRDGLCTVTFPNGSPQPQGASCINPAGCEAGLECTLNVCRCPAGANCGPYAPLAGRVCEDPGDCLSGFQCTLGTCRCPVGTPGCICARDCDGKACGADDGCGGTCPCDTGAACGNGLACKAGDACISGTCQAVPWCNYAGGVACEPTVRVRQNALDRFYSMTNIVTIDVTVDDTNTSVTPVRTTWDDLVEELPPTNPANNHPCYWDFQPPDQGRFDDWVARSVTISGLNYPAAPVTYTTPAGVGPDDDSAVRITKKSFCGSSNIAWDEMTQQLSVAHRKPAFKIRLPIQAEDGPLQTRYLVFNNSVQDSSFIRQAVGYRLFEKALLPHSRNNFARINILRTDGSLIATWNYVNIEPIRAPYIENPFNNFTHHTITLDSGNDRRVPGNLYEFEKDDFDPERIVPPNNFIAPEGISNRNNVGQTEDLLIAAAKIQEEIDNQQQPGPVGSALQQAIDLDQFIRYFAMEVLLKHWDGYTENLNNVYVYNDTDDPDVGPTRFKFIPWGLDQILEPFDEEDEYPEDPYDGISKISLFRIGPPEGDKDDSGLGRLVRNNLALLNRLSDQIRIYRENVFSRDYINGDLNNFIVLMQTQLDALGQLDTDEINEVREMIKVARSAAYYFGQGYTESYFAGERFLDVGALGLTTGDATGAFLIDKVTGSALFAGLENIPGGTPQQFEVYHGVQADNSSAARWWFETAPGISARVLRNEAFARYLYSSVNPLRVMATSVLNPDCGYNTEFETGEWELETRVDNRFSGYLRLMSYPQSNYIRFTADDVSPTGQLRVTQTNPSANPPPLPSELAARLRLW